LLTGRARDASGGGVCGAAPIGAGAGGVAVPGVVAETGVTTGEATGVVTGAATDVEAGAAVVVDSCAHATVVAANHAASRSGAHLTAARP